MARATITKRFELSPEAVGSLEAYARETGQSQTAVIEAACLLLGPERIKRGNPPQPDSLRSYEPCPACLGNGVPGCQRCDGQGIISTLGAVPEQNTLSPEAKGRREQVKAEKRERKARLQTEAGGLISARGKGVLDPERMPSLPEGGRQRPGGAPVFAPGNPCFDNPVETQPFRGSFPKPGKK